MANLTDPLANPVHGTNPQNLIEYITRQKIYSTTFWKEECFGLNAQDIAAKAALRVKCIGGSYGGNSQPCRFLCMVLKMLQIGIEDDILEEFLQNEDFKYVRLMGMFYLRLTARPADIYEKLEPFYSDYRKVRHRLTNGWEIIHVDEYVHTLLTKNEMCGITFPRLPKRENLEEAGYLDEGPRRTALGEGIDKKKATAMLKELASDGNEQAKKALEQRQKLEEEKSSRNSFTIEKERKHERSDKSFKREVPRNTSRSRSRSWGRDERDNSYNDHRSSRYHSREDYHDYHKRTHSDRGYDVRTSKQNNDTRESRKRSSKGKEKRKRSENYGTLFKKSKDKQKEKKIKGKEEENQVEEGSIEYWNRERAKLGLKPLEE